MPSDYLNDIYSYLYEYRDSLRSRVEAAHYELMDRLSRLDERGELQWPNEDAVEALSDFRGAVDAQIDAAAEACADRARLMDHYADARMGEASDE